MDDPYKRRVERAEGSNKIFQNQVKYIVFFFVVATGSLTIWEKCRPAHKAELARQQPIDSVARPAGSPHPVTTGLNHRRHPVKKDSSPAGGSGQADLPTGKPSDPSVTTKPPPRVASPLQVTSAEDIQFKLVSAEGFTRAQTIRMTVVLINSAANRHVWSDVHSIVDPDGNVYELKSFTCGGSTVDERIVLDTDVPMRCTYTFGGVLPSVRMIKLFKFEYRHKSLDDPNAVEFRDIPIDWK